MEEKRTYVWDEILTETDREVIRRGGYGRPRGLGKSPALMLIDVLAVCREKSLPVIYTRHVQKDLKFDGFAMKTRRDQAPYLAGTRGTMIIASLLPEEGDIVIDKSYASAFYGTPLLSYLVKLGIDTLIVTGGTTSGCVRAACIDAVTRGFNCAVLADCVYDRISASHKISLLDLWMKYCDVMESAELLAYLHQR